MVNCGEEVSYPSPAQRLFVNQGNRIATVLALGAADRVAAVSSVGDDRDVLAAAYGAEVVDGLVVATEGQPSLENVVARRADVVVSWFGDGDAVSPERLAERSIAAYQSTEGCRKGTGAERGTVEPWEALRTDLRGLGRITGREGRAEEVVRGIEERLGALAAAPAAAERPSVFLFDRGTSDVYSSGAYGAPQAIIEAAGARNALGDLEESWTSVSWERVVAARPDFIAFVDYGRQSFEDKVAVLRTNPGHQGPARRRGGAVPEPAVRDVDEQPVERGRRRAPAGRAGGGEPGAAQRDRGAAGRAGLTPGPG